MAEFINITGKDWGFRGDKGTWVRQEDDGSITIQRAAKGTMSRTYTEEMQKFCASHGVDFDSIHPGDRITIPAK